MKFTSILSVLALASATLATPVLEERHHDRDGECRGRGRVETVYKKVYKAKTTVTKTKTKTYYKTKHWCKHDPWRHFVKTKTATKHITTTNTINFTSTKTATLAITLPAETSTSTITKEAPIETVTQTIQKTVSPITITQTTTAPAEPVTITITSAPSTTTSTTTSPTSTPAPACTPPSNLVQSGSFEDNNSLWSHTYTGTPLHDDLVGPTPWGGRTGLTYFSTGGGPTLYNPSPFILTLSQPITFCPSLRYRFSCWYRAESVSWDFEVSFSIKLGGREIGTSPARSIRQGHGEAWYQVGPFEFESQGERELLEIVATAARNGGDAGRGREIHVDDVVIEAV